MSNGKRPKKKRPLNKEGTQQETARPVPQIIGSKSAQNIPPELLTHLQELGAQQEDFAPPQGSPIPPIRKNRRKVKVSSKISEMEAGIPEQPPIARNVVRSTIHEELIPEDYDIDETEELPEQVQPYTQPIQTQIPQQQPKQPVQSQFVLQKPAHIRRFVGQLPSRGIPYRNVGAYIDGKIDICPMTTKEESLLYSPGDSLAHINKILDSCIVDADKAKLDTLDLTINDRFAVLLYIRTFSYGSNYEIPFTCVSCNYHNPKLEIDISSDLSMNFMEEGDEEPFEVDLPRSGDYIHFRLLRGRDEETIAKYAKRMKMQAVDEGDPSNIYRLALAIVGINGVEANDFDYKVEYVKSMIAGDANTLRIAIQEADGRIDTTLFIECPSCGFTNKFDMPFTAEFFRPSR